MPKKRTKRRTRSSSPGVVLVERRRADGPSRVRARWTDPDSGKTCWLTLNDGVAMKLKTAKAREEWARDKSDSLAARRAELAAGGPRVVGTTIAKAAEKYLKARGNEVRASTLREVSRSVNRFVDWAEAVGISATAELTTARVADFRDHVFAMKKQAIHPGGERGRHKVTRSPLSPQTKNVILGHVGTMLRDLRRRGLVKLDGDDLRDGLRKARTARKVPNFLDSPSIRELLEAALRHDAETFRLTREEHDGGRAPGTTRKHPPAGPFTLFVLLTGMRRGEAEGLRWDEVDLDRGAITLDADRTKTALGRRVDLAVSLSLVELLRALRLQAGGAVHVFPKWKGGGLADATAKRLRADFGAPAGFTWQALRRTCSTFGTNWQVLGPWGSAKRCGHSVVVAERSYAGLVTVDPEVETFEQAMGFADLAERIVRAAGGFAEDPSASVAGAG